MAASQISQKLKANSFKDQIRNSLKKELFLNENIDSSYSPCRLKSLLSPQNLKSNFTSAMSDSKNEDEIKLKEFEESYQIEESIGQGAHAVVKKATNKKENFQVAIKIIRSGDGEIIRSVMREFKNVSLLNNPSIVKPYDLYIDKINERIYYVMELVKMKSLSRLINKKGMIDEKICTKIIFEIIKTVAYMHYKGVCHRDLTSKNILISKDLKSIKIIDFGVSKQFTHYSFKNGSHLKKSVKMFTSTGVLSYLAPEILRGDGYNSNVDIWSIGILTYELLSGHKPFDSKYVSDTTENINNAKLTFLEPNWINNTKLSKDFITRLLKPNPHLRLSAKEALNHPWLMEHSLKENEGKFEKKKILIDCLKSKKPEIKTFGNNRHRIPSIDDIELEAKFKTKLKANFMKLKKEIFDPLNKHVHFIEKQYKPSFYGIGLNSSQIKYEKLKEETEEEESKL